MIKLNARGEVADFQDASQFEPKESEFAVSEFAGTVVKFAGYPGGGATSTQEEINQVADASFYTKYIGPNVESDTQGTSIEVIHQIKGLWGTLPRYIEPTKQRYCSSWGVSIIGVEMGSDDTLSPARLWRGTGTATTQCTGLVIHKLQKR